MASKNGSTNFFDGFSHPKSKKIIAILERFFAGRSVEEIAKKQFVSPQEIRAHINLGLIKLKAQLELQELL